MLAVVFLMCARADAQVVKIRNESGEMLVEFYLAQDGNSDWEEEMLEDDVLENGESIEIDIDTDGIVGDILVITEDGNEISKFGIDFDRSGIITIKQNGISVGSATQPARTPKKPTAPKKPAPKRPSRPPSSGST